MLSDNPDSRSVVGYDCKFCIAKDMMGRTRGRLCLLYQVDLEEDVLVYSTSTQDRRLSGEVTSEAGFMDAVSLLMEAHATDRVEAVLKFFSFPGVVSGVCPKSFPRSTFTNRLLEVINMCIGGESGVQLVQLPFPGSLMDQPNVFLQAYSMFVQEHYSWTSKRRRESESKNKR